MRYQLKGLVAFVLSVTLALVPSVTLCAGQPEEPVDSDVIQVVLPTNAGNVFDFILDPQRLIEETDAAAYGGQSFEEGATLFFQRLDGGVEEAYHSTSDAVTIVNKSAVPVEVTLTAEISGDSLGGIRMTEDESFADDAGASMYLALTDGEHKAPILEEEGACIQVTIPAASEETAEFPEYSFRLMGAANEHGDWSEIRGAAPKVAVTWVVVPVEGSMPSAQEDLPDEEQGLPEDLKLGTPSNAVQ